MGYDLIEQFTDRSHPVRGVFATAILMNLVSRDFELVELLNLPSNLYHMIVARSLSFVGVVGIVNGSPRSALEVPLDPAAIAMLTAAYLRIVEARMKARLEIDELAGFGRSPRTHTTPKPASVFSRQVKKIKPGTLGPN